MGTFPPVLESAHPHGSVVGGPLFVRDPSTHKWTLSRLNINNGFLQVHTNGIHHSGQFDLFIGSNNKL